MSKSTNSNIGRKILRPIFDGTSTVGVVTGLSECGRFYLLDIEAGEIDRVPVNFASSSRPTWVWADAHGGNPAHHARNTLNAIRMGRPEAEVSAHRQAAVDALSEADKAKILARLGTSIGADKAAVEAQATDNGDAFRDAVIEQVRTMLKVPAAKAEPAKPTDFKSQVSAPVMVFKRQ